MIATVSNPTTFELKTANGFLPSFYPNFIQNPQTFNQKSEKQFVEIEFPDFDYKFRLKIVKQNNDSKKIEQTLELTKDVYVNLQLFGELSRKPERFYINDVSLGLEMKNQRPISNFIATSFLAMLGLSKVNLSWINNGIGSFPKSLIEISTYLQNRQFSYRLMVIEKALKTSFLIPKRKIEREEIDYISYCYHSIVDRKFEFEADSKHEIGETETKNIGGELFGNKVDLGIQKVSIVKRGIMKVESITTPHLPKNVFNKDIQKLIDLDSKLDSIVLDKYFALAASTLEGLTEEQKKAITERPNLDEDAFDF